MRWMCGWDALLPLQLTEGFQRQYSFQKLGVRIYWLEKCAHRRLGTPWYMSKKKAQVFLSGYRTGRNNDLGVPLLAFLSRPPDEVEEEATQGFEDGGGCDSGFLCVCVKQERPTSWCPMELRSSTAVSHLCDTGVGRSEESIGVFVWLLSWFPKGLG